MHRLWGTSLSMALKTFFLAISVNRTAIYFASRSGKLIKIPNSEVSISNLKEKAPGNSLAVQRFGLGAFTACGPRFNPWSGNQALASCTVWPESKMSKRKRSRLSWRCSDIAVNLTEPCSPWHSPTSPDWAGDNMKPICQGQKHGVRTRTAGELCLTRRQLQVGKHSLYLVRQDIWG